MGIFSCFKEVKKAWSYLNLEEAELRILPDEELREALDYRCRGKIGSDRFEQCVLAMKKYECVFYVLDWFDREIQNGGLCQFFVNSSSEVAPYVAECLDEIGADAYHALYVNFLDKHHISPNELESFAIFSIEEYQEQVERYPFDEFDYAYYDLYERDPLETRLMEYVRGAM